MPISSESVSIVSEMCYLDCNMVLTTVDAVVGEVTVYRALETQRLQKLVMRSCAIGDDAACLI